MGISFLLRIALIVMSAFTFVFIIRQIQKNRIEIGQSLFWIVISFVLLIISLFPQISIFFSNLLGVKSASNFVFLVAIFIIMVKLFTLSIDHAIEKKRLKSLIVNVSLKNAELEKKVEDLENKFGK